MDRKVSPSGELAKVTMGIQVSPAMALVMVAKDRGTFSAHGVDVEIKEFTAGKFALQAFLGGALDFCVSGEVPVCLATLNGNPIRVVSAVVRETVNEVRVVARRDGPEVVDAPTYFKSRKRRLATSFGGGPEFFTYSFLNHYGIAPDQVEILSQKPEDMPASLVAGSVDAVAIFDPFAFIAEKKIGKDGITFANRSLYSEYYVLCASEKQLKETPATTENVLRGLADAAAWMKANPEESQAIVTRFTKQDQDVVAGIWKNFRFEPALPAKLLKVWDEQADWAVKTNKAPKGTKAPDWRSIIDASFLMKVDPKAVEIGS